MVRKRIPLVTRPDPDYSASLSPHGPRPDSASSLPESPISVDTAEQMPDAGRTIGPDPVAQPDRMASSIQIDVRATALDRQAAALSACGIAPAQVIRAALRRAVKRWTLCPTYMPPAPHKRAGDTSWTARTSVAVPAAVFDRLQATQDPLGVCSRWSLVRGQLEPLIWEEIDALLDTLQDDHPSAG
ncbi:MULTISPECIES: hypothetical protein [Paracoccaceae]|jgi:hypothetical protein|uniref:hypothetical protein n=1 Tax=Paracoccaceae TaxID=31989 RepID=UPI0015717501|nr:MULTISPECIES: hypothetical protein [Paracoccaceae]MBJ2153463.1 hypothetical protein [Paracoccus sp. IB05]NTT88441.1 hypothetical protein [Tabrizicola sp. SY72]